VGDLVPGVARDVRVGLRALRKTPAFAAGAIVTVALAVGATTAIFSVVYGVLLRQLPYRDVERVFWIWSDQPGRDRTPFNVPDFIDYRDSTRTLAGLAGFFSYSANLSEEAAAERVQGIRATGNLFDVLGTPARFGRLLQPGDELPGAAPVVVLTEPFWTRRFGGDRTLIGRAIRLNSEEYTVVGIVAGGFALPVRDVEFVLPFAVDQDPRRGARNSVNFIIGAGRLGDRVALPQASSELVAIARRLQEQFPVENARKQGVRMVGVLDGIVGPFRTVLLAVFGAVGAVLLIACANLANLMLARAAGRRRDVAVQLALGSPRGTVVRQVLVEALLVSIAGGTLGMMAARWGAAGLMALAPSELPRSGEVRVDLAVLLFSLAVATLTGVLFGVIPALMSAGVDVREALQAGSRGATGGGRRIRGLLVQLGGCARGRPADRDDDAGEELRQRAGGRAGFRSGRRAVGAADAAGQAVQPAGSDCGVPASAHRPAVGLAGSHPDRRDHPAAVERDVLARAVHGRGTGDRTGARAGRAVPNGVGRLLRGGAHSAAPRSHVLDEGHRPDAGGGGRERGACQPVACRDRSDRRPPARRRQRRRPAAGGNRRCRR
jgi:HAMP domain-containing protein